MAVDGEVMGGTGLIGDNVGQGGFDRFGGIALEHAGTFAFCSLNQGWLLHGAGIGNGTVHRRLFNWR